MRPFFALTLLASFALSSCADDTCKSACERVYLECGAEHSDPAYPTAEGAVKVCTADCLSAMYNDRDTENTTLGFTDEESAVAFVNCVNQEVDPSQGDCSSRARGQCGAPTK